MQPRPYQEKALKDLEAGNWTGMLAADLGTGKSPMATWAAQRAGSQHVLIIAPLRTEPGWARTVREIIGTELRPCTNSRANTKERRQNTTDLFNGVPGWYFITWELMRTRNTHKVFDRQKNRTVSKSVTHPFNGTTFDHVIADEVHRACNKSSQSSQVLTRIRARHRLALSATPAGDQPVNIFGALKFLYPKRFSSFERFGTQFFHHSVDPFSSTGFGRIYGAEKRPGAVRRTVPTWIDIKAKDVLTDLPEVTVVRVDATMTAAQWRQYKGWKEQAIAWLGEHPLAIDMPMTKDMRLRQATLGELSLAVDQDGREQVSYDKDCKSGKIDALLDILSDIGDEQVVVYVHSQRFMTPLLHRLRKAGYSAIEVSGKSSDKWEDFRDGKVQVMCAVIEAVAEGVDGLQHNCRTEIWLSQSNQVVKNLQATGRLNRSGQKRGVIRYLINCPGTIDTDAVEPRLNRKYKDLKDSGLI